MIRLSHKIITNRIKWTIKIILKKSLKHIDLLLNQKSFKNKWEAKVTYMLLNGLADIVELEKRVIELEKKLKLVEGNNDKQNMH
jgi:hypothetical protein